MLSRFNFHVEVQKRLVARARLIITDHANQRMQERDISMEDVRQCLLRGRAVENPAHDSIKQSTTCRMDHPTSENGWTVSVVVGLPDEKPQVVVITVYGNES